MIGLFILGSVWVLFRTPTTFGCVTNNRAQGLISAQSQSGFGNNIGGSSPCVNGNQALLPVFQIPTFNDLKGEYYDQFKQVSGTVKNAPLARSGTDADVVGARANNSTNYIVSDLIISNAITLINSNASVIFVGGNMTISNNITDPNGVLVFVVKGDVNINKAVTRIDGVIFSNGTICSAFETGVGCPDPGAGNNPLNYTDPNTTSQLNVNGSLISLDPTKHIIFRRKLFNNNNPAELINQQPKFFVLLKDLFSQTVSITTENTNYSLDLTTLPPVP